MPRILVEVALKPLLRYGVVNAPDPVLHKREEAFNCVGVNVSADVDVLFVRDPVMRSVVQSRRDVSGPFVGIKDRRGEYVAVKLAPECGGRTIGHDGGTNLATALHGTEYDRLAAGHVELGLPRHKGLTMAPEVCGSAFPANERLVGLNLSGQRLTVLGHQFVANEVGHAPCGFVGDAKLALQLLSGDSATSAGHQVHSEEPQMQRSGRFVEDRSCRGVDVVAAGVTVPSRTPRYLVEFPFTVARRAVGVMATLGVAVTPKPFKARRVVAKLAHELHQRVIRFRGLRSLRVIPIDWRHR